MSNRYKGGVISATPPTLVAGAGASGTWTLEQQMQATAAGLWPVNGPFYIEDVFSTWLYQGTSANQTITNGIDLSTKGGLVWCKGRPNAGYSHRLFDTSRGVNNSLATNLTDAQSAQTNSVTAFNTTGFSLGTDANGEVNFSGSTYVGWTFRKQPKFFDVVTYTGDGTLPRNISHNLGSTPGCIIVKCTSTTGDWYVYHRSAGGNLVLNTTAKEIDDNRNVGNPTSSVFRVGTNGYTNFTNINGATYVAYLFAHNAGGFGLTGTDNVISCGIVNGASAPTVNLGYEPQFVMFKAANTTGNWLVYDNMRGWTANNGSGAGNVQQLLPNTSGAETATTSFYTTSTGFAFGGSTVGFDYIYIAIRRGPMKVPTSGTSVLGLNARSGTSANATVTGGAGVTDLAIIKRRNSTSNWVWTPRLTGTGYLSSNLIAAETAAGTTILQANPWDVMDGVKVGTTSTLTNASGSTFINYLLDRAPGFMDVVCYTGTGTAQNITHNLGVAPELIICKVRISSGSWAVWHSGLTSISYALALNSTNAQSSQPGYWNSTLPTSSVFSVGTAGETNQTTETFVAYLFATLAGVSKVGSYTGNGSTQTINCGFTGGARFVLIKNTSAVENWQIFDTARGMVAGTDPELRPNTTDAEVNVSNMVYTATTGFELVTSNAVVNGTGNSYIFLAIA